jgi:DNA-binding response OmpR family regulator
MGLQYCNAFIKNMQKQKTPPNERPKILIIDDDKMLLEMFKKKFQREDFEIQVTDDASLGLEYAIEMKPDLILLDIMMPDMDGFEALHAFREFTGLDVIIVVFSNLSQPLTGMQLMSLGADEYLLKANYTPAEIVRYAASLIAEKRNNLLAKAVA